MLFRSDLIRQIKRSGATEISLSPDAKEIAFVPVSYTHLNIDIEYAAKVGSEVVNINAINSYIETLVNSRAMSNENVIKVLKAVVGTYNLSLIHISGPIPN